MTIDASGYREGVILSLFLFEEAVFLGTLVTGEEPREISAAVGDAFRRTPLTIQPGEHSVVARNFRDPPEVEDPSLAPRVSFFFPGCIAPTPTPVEMPTSDSDDGAGVGGILISVGIGLAVAIVIVAVAVWLYRRYRE